MPLTKWFWALYWVGTDKGGISALRLSKLIDVQWRTAYSMLRRLRIAMGQRDSRYRLTDLIEVDDAYLGANKTGKAGHGGGRTPILVAIEKTEDGNPGFVAIEALDSLSKPEIVDFAKRHLHPDAICHTDAFPSLKGLAIHTTHIAKITPSEEADHWLPWVHVVISNLKRFLLGTYQGAVRPHRLQEDIDEFVYRFNGVLGTADPKSSPSSVRRVSARHHPWNMNQVQPHVLIYRPSMIFERSGIGFAP